MTAAHADSLTDAQRCPWCRGDPLSRLYHDQEWGVPCREDTTLFEFLILEGAQAGLSWRTVLHKRDNYRRALDGFDPYKVAAYDPQKIHLLLQDAGLIRNRMKLESAVINANAFLRVRDSYGSFAEFIWSFVEGQPLTGQIRSPADLPVSTPQSEAMARVLKKKGFRFVGGTICYAFMQATGMVNDHQLDCFRYTACQQLASG
ncbi:MAG: DNA-3-methyladenine glycosylase I [Kistimonas sp.]|nr:DNA-3-methyladenine glycosylase I [Kistimonas sp.]